MSSSPNQNLLFLLFSSIIFTSTSSSSLQTIAISHIKNKTLVCALLPSLSNPHYYDLNCTSFPNGTTHHYPAGNNPYSAIAAGDGFLCALTSPLSTNLSTMRWWDFEHNPHKNSLPDPKRVYLGPSLSSMTAGDNHVCGIIEGQLRCWRWAQLDIPKGSIFTKVAVGANFVCGLSVPDSEIKCFGNDLGVVKNVPDGKFKDVAAGTSHACAISVDGKFFCWGNGSPELPKGDKIQVVLVALGNNRTCVLDNMAIVHCWGKDIGLPADLITARFVNIQARGDDFCGILMSNYSLICWGSENFHVSNHVVFKQVLPGACATTCPCLPLPGSGNFCSNGQTMCSPCPNSSIKTHNSTSVDKSPKTSENHRRRLIFIILGSVGFFIGLLSVASFIFFKIKQKHRRIHDSVRLGSRNSFRSRFESTLDVHIRQLFTKGHNSTIEEFSISYLSSITNNFSDDHKIGSGSFGSVYRAKLKDGRIVAIKRAETSTAASTSRARTPNGGKSRLQDKESAFCSELSLLSRVNHKNLVRLFGYCKEGFERILVYEFMTKGTLHDLLHKSEGSTLDTWASRIKVALDAARGIEYLHTYAVPPIIHRDIKSSNILLDDSNVAKVSDFGLSLLTPDPNHVNETNGYDLPLSTAGTVGYMDPEYYRLRQLTAKSDVYSFGVVLLEILSGCRVIQKYEESGTPKNVVEYAIPHIQADNIQHVLDGRIALPTPKEMEAVAYVSYLATDCVNQEGRDRPTMTEVVNGLERAFGAVSNPLSPSRSSTTVRSN